MASILRSGPDKEIFVSQLRHCTILHPGLPDCRCGDLKSADSPTRGKCQTVGVRKVNSLGRRKAAVWSKLLSFEKKFGGAFGRVSSSRVGPHSEENCGLPAYRC